jgi:hypothetical protein
MVSELALVAPDLDGICASLERCCRRPVHLVPVIMAPGAPFGICIRTTGADYLYYEQQTSPFHQAHIVLCLAVQLLLGDEAGGAIDLRLIPDVSPELVQVILGGSDSRPVPDSEAEAFALLAMDWGGGSSCPALLALHFLRQLQPLRSALLGAVPEAARPSAVHVRLAIGPRLHQQVIEIRDAALALRPWQDARVASAAAEAGRAAGLDGDDLAASVEAAVLATALRAKVDGHPGLDEVGDTWQPHSPGSDLRSEAAWLVKVSRAFSRLPQARQSVGDSRSGDSPEGDSRLGKGPTMSMRSAPGSRLDGHQTPIESWKSRRRFARRTRL